MRLVCVPPLTSQGHLADAHPCTVSSLPAQLAHPTPHTPRLLASQARGCIIVASSPEILCRVDEQGRVTNR